MIESCIKEEWKGTGDVNVPRIRPGLSHLNAFEDNSGYFSMTTAGVASINLYERLSFSEIIIRTMLPVMGHT